MSTMKNSSHGHCINYSSDDISLGLFVLGFEIGSYLDGATYHNFYFFLKGDIDHKTQNQSKVNECIQFMKHNSSINYAQAIVSVYCDDIKDWNQTPQHYNYYTFRLNSSRTATFKDTTMAITMIDKNPELQQQLHCLIDKLDRSPFDTPSLRSVNSWYQNSAVGSISFYLGFITNDKYKNNIDWIKPNIHYAIVYDHFDILKLLLFTKNREKLINSDIFFGQTPLISACYHNRLNMIEYLLSIGANPNIRHKSNLKLMRVKSALFFAITKRHPKIVKLLFEHGANVQSLNNTIAHFILEYSISCEMFDVLTENKIDCNIVNNKGQNPLICICANSNQVNINQTNTYLNASFAYIFEKLIEKTDQINKKDIFRKTALDYVLRRSNCSDSIPVRLLMQKNGQYSSSSMVMHKCNVMVKESSDTIKEKSSKLWRNLRKKSQTK